uniref:Uncharacterized protein n=1 Tax=Arundo donax TaxID=35708 RepID=A0A0A9DF34_ARUDO
MDKRTQPWRGRESCSQETRAAGAAAQDELPAVERLERRLPFLPLGHSKQIVLLLSSPESKPVWLRSPVARLRWFLAISRAGQ